MVRTIVVFYYSAFFARRKRLANISSSRENKENTKGSDQVEKRHLKGSTFFFPGKVNVGYFQKNEEVWLVDTGLDDEAGRKIARFLETENKKLRCIVGTHSNADHCGGNAFLKKRTGCLIAATPLEAAVMENTFMEPLLLWTAFPFAEISNRFLQAKPSSVDILIRHSGVFDESGLEAVPLPGHFLEMIGVRTPDGVFFVADALFSETLLEKYHIIFVLDVQAALETLTFLDKQEADWFVPSHAPAVEDIRPLAEANRRSLMRVSQAVLDSCSEPIGKDEIVKRVGALFGISMSITEFLLYSAAISAHLTWLRKNALISPFVEDGLLLWRRTP
ncbi:MAG: MBL fold metallo-hydrolase [Synergistaceae bacterium]|jgi:glyoxylase-like metal-dependent hydrolase (beta-lactamase superfamily II)|nr:MBL fold metallo-hydrolase [Synergistaceae bacterium]